MTFPSSEVSFADSYPSIFIFLQLNMLEFLTNLGLVVVYAFKGSRALSK